MPGGGWMPAYRMTCSPGVRRGRLPDRPGLSGSCVPADPQRACGCRRDAVVHRDTQASDGTRATAQSVVTHRNDCDTRCQDTIPFQVVLFRPSAVFQSQTFPADGMLKAQEALIYKARTKRKRAANTASIITRFVSDVGEKRAVWLRIF
jgi:hypothetical protein